MNMYRKDHGHHDDIWSNKCGAIFLIAAMESQQMDLFAWRFRSGFSVTKNTKFH